MRIRRKSTDLHLVKLQTHQRWPINIVTFHRHGPWNWNEYWDPSTGYPVSGGKPFGGILLRQRPTEKSFISFFIIFSTGMKLWTILCPTLSIFMYLICSELIVRTIFFLHNGNERGFLDFLVVLCSHVRAKILLCDFFNSHTFGNHDTSSHCETYVFKDMALMVFFCSFQNSKLFLKYSINPHDFATGADL